MLIDEVNIIVKSGRGGDGIVHFRREKYVPRGGPDGGDGGNGGDVIFEISPQLNTLSSFRHQALYVAQDGKRGGKNNMTGRSGDDLLISVPKGTMIFDENSGALLGDLVQIGQRLVICQGGRGGNGNAHYATSRNQVPRLAERGSPSEEKHLRLELKLLADVGIIGVPNAGKSTLLSVLTNAKPKIGPFPFTTLEPNLGVINIDDQNAFVIADLPGLIEGAHKGIGLGHNFLRHIQRTKILIHLLDGNAENPLADFSQINSELALFDINLRKKPQIIAINKIDLPQVRSRLTELEQQLIKMGQKPIFISALARTNLDILIQSMTCLIYELPEEPVSESIPIYTVSTDPRHYQINRTSDGWVVTGEAIVRAASMTNWEYDESIRRFQRILGALGIEEALRAAGVHQGDTVFIGDYELEWHD